MFKLIFKTIRLALLGALGTAAVAKFVLESHAEPVTEEIDLVSIFEGKTLVSEADPFYGGKVMAMFGGVTVDLRNATPAPTGIFIDVALVMSGMTLVVPEGWRVRYDGRLTLGGWSDQTRTTADEDVPTVAVSGVVLFGGLTATTKPRPTRVA